MTKHDKRVRILLQGSICDMTTITNTISAFSVLGFLQGSQFAVGAEFPQ